MSRHPLFKFRLYVAGDTENSALAISNLEALCGAYLPDDHEIEIVDVFREPKRAQVDGILMTPSLLKLSPAPVQKIIGTLSQSHTLLRALGLKAKAA